MIKTTLREILTVYTPTASGRTPMQAFSSLGLASQKAWDRMLAIEAIDSHRDRFVRARKEIVDKHAVNNDSGRPLPIDENHPKLAQIDSELGGLLDVEVSINVEATPPSEIGSGPISADEIKGIRFLLK
jgi:hypothetical protein